MGRDVRFNRRRAGMAAIAGLPALVALGSEAGDVVIDLGLQRFGQHPASTITNDLIDQRGAVPAGFISAIGSRNCRICRRDE